MSPRGMGSEVSAAGLTNLIYHEGRSERLTSMAGYDAARRVTLIVTGSGLVL